MENVRKRVNVKLINNEEKYLKVVSRPSFVSQKILDKNLVAVHKIKLPFLITHAINITSFLKVISSDNLSSVSSEILKSLSFSVSILLILF